MTEQESNLLDLAMGKASPDARLIDPFGHREIAWGRKSPFPGSENSTAQSSQTRRSRSEADPKAGIKKRARRPKVNSDG